MGVAIDGSDVYFCDRWGATIDWVSKTGGVVTSVAKVSEDPVLDVAVDDTCVHWTALTSTGEDAQVAKVFAAPK